MSSISVSRRQFNSAAATLLAGTVLAACSDEQTSTSQATSTNDGAEVTPETTATVVEAREPEGSVDAAELMAADSLPEMQLGPDDAPVTVVEYASATCGHCANFHNRTWPAIKEKYVDTGKVRFVFREFPLDPLSTGAFMLARCADDNYFPMIDVLFKQQTTWARAEKPSAELYRIAQLAGFTQESFEACLTNDDLMNDVIGVQRRASEEFEVRSTPTFFVNGDKFTGDMPVDVFSAIIDRALQ